MEIDRDVRLRVPQAPSPPKWHSGTHALLFLVREKLEFGGHWVASFTLNPKQNPTENPNSSGLVFRILGCSGLRVSGDSDLGDLGLQCT